MFPRISDLVQKPKLPTVRLFVELATAKLDYVSVIAALRSCRIIGSI
jgi:hypothetical protein